MASRPRLVQCAGCGKQTSLTAGTVFHGTRKPLRAWFKAMFLMSTQKNGTSAMNVKRQVGINYETAWVWLHKLRAAMSAGPRTKLTGRIEFDECFVGGEEPGVPGRGAVDKALVAVAVEIREEHLGRVRMTVIEDASQATLTNLARHTVEAGADVHTDAWSGYSRLTDASVTHHIHKSGRGRKAAQTLPHVHLVISLLNRVLRGAHQGAVARRHLQSYLNEYTFRFNRRLCRFATGIFERLARAAVNIRVTYASIVKLQHARPLTIAA